MNWIILIVIVFVAVTLLAVLQCKSDAGAGAEYQYQKIEKLFTPAERSFLGVIDEVVDGDFRVFGKVRVADIIKPKSGLSRSDWQKLFNKISGKHFDFVLCKKDDLSVLCAFELNDKSHNSSNRAKRDEFLKKACESANIPLHYIPAKSGYKIEDIKKIINPYITITVPKSKENSNHKNEYSKKRR